MKNPKRILVAAENQEEASNLIPILSILNNQDNFQIYPIFLSLDKIYFQNVESLLKNCKIDFHQPQYYFPLERSIYYYPRHIQLWFSINNYRNSRFEMENFDAFLCGITGIAQRGLAIQAKIQNKPNFQIITGRMSPRIAHSKKNQVYLRLFKSFPRECYLFPGGYLAGSVLMDKIFCVGDADKNLINSLGLNGEVHNYGVPMYEYLFKSEDSPSTPLLNDGVRNLLYLSGAFKWHRSNKQHLQDNLLKDLVETIDKMEPEYRLIVKIHPREQLSDYAWLNGFEKVKVVTGRIEHAIEKAYLVIAIASTGLLEAIKWNKVAVCLLSGFPESDIYWDLAEELPFIPVFKSGDDLRRFLNMVDTQEKYQSYLLQQQKEIDYFISPSTPQSAKKIAHQITEALL